MIGTSKHPALHSPARILLADLILFEVLSQMLHKALRRRRKCKVAPLQQLDLPV